MEFKHTSVLLNECIDGLNIKPEGVYVDGTLGGAGHSYEICKHLSEKGMLIGIDQDAFAIETSTKKLEGVANKVIIVRDNYVAFKNIMEQLEIKKVDGILLDLGVSSHQLDEAERGFSYMKEAPLDMRMDQRQVTTAKSLVNTYTEEALTKIFFEYGEEKFSRKIASNIVKARAEKPIETTSELVAIIDRSIPTKFKVMGGHPAKRTFQAIRIELNQELVVLKSAIQDMIDALSNEGRLCIITFHSLEDRIVKTMFKDNEDPCTCPRTLPMCVCGKKSKGKVISRKPILPTEIEMDENSRARSAKLRIFERIGGEYDADESGKS